MKKVIASITVCILLLILSGCQGAEPYTGSVSFTAPEGWPLGEIQEPFEQGKGGVLEQDGLEAAYDIAHGDGTPQAWYAPGGIYWFDDTEVKLLTYENEVLVDANYRPNHTSRTEAQILDTHDFDDPDLQAVLIEYEFDLFTAPEWADYEAQHPDASEKYLTSRYYYVFLGKDKADTGVCIFMNKDVFTKDDIVEMARSVQF